MLTIHYKRILKLVLKTFLLSLAMPFILGSSLAFAEPITLPGTIRDFSTTHPDFQNWAHGNKYLATGLVESFIGTDRKPVLKSIMGEHNGNSVQAITSADTFAQWFNDVPNINETKTLDIILEKTGDVYNFNSELTPMGNTGTSQDGFFPIDGQMLGNEGNEHNFHFSYEMHSRFTYKGGETLSFEGDDDVWVYINDQLVLDLGGVHLGIKGTVNLDTLGLTLGENYNFDFFFVERHKVHSNLILTTSIEFFSCVGFTGEVNEVDLPLTSQLKATDKLFIPSKSVSAAEGHLRAYSIDANGVQATASDWDAASPAKMGNRAAKLYSTDDSGQLVLFDSLSEPDQAIQTFTIDSVLGGVSKGNSLEILSNEINTSLYLQDVDYRDYFTNTVSNRNKRVLMSSDDGFLYAFNYDTGELVWAWMPRSLTSELTGTDSYQNRHLMAGSVDILDLNDGTNYATYVVGSYKSGQAHYVLKLDSDGNLASVVWDDGEDPLNASYTQFPNYGEMEFFKDGNGKTYAAYVLANTVPESKLKIRSLTDTNENLTVDLNHQASSTPFVMPDYGKSNAPASKTLYLGSSVGDIYSSPLLKANGELESNFTFSQVTSMDENPTGPVLHINSSVSAKDNLYYLSTQTAKRLTLHRYKASSLNPWKQAWTSYSSGSGTWNEFDVYSADSSGGIQQLPVDAFASAKATIVGDAIVLPISVLPAADSNVCYSSAYYYLYSLSGGGFPSKTFFNNDNKAISANIALGYGEAKQLNITDMAGSDNLKGYGIADQNTSLQSGVATSFNIKDPVTSGIRAWKELGKH